MTLQLKKQQEMGQHQYSKVQHLHHSQAKTQQAATQPAGNAGSIEIKVFWTMAKVIAVEVSQGTGSESWGYRCGS